MTASSAKPVPDFFIAGFNRSGTSTLHALLSQHPRIDMSEPKELHVYNFNSNYERRGDIFRNAFVDFKSDTMKGDATPSYIYHGVMFGEGKDDYLWQPEDDSIKRLASHAPEAKVIVSLRHPIKTAFSNFNKAQLHGRERLDISFKQALDDEIEGQRTYKETFLCHHYLTQYSLHIEHLLKHVKREKILFLKFEDWTQNQEKALHEISHFLGLDMPENFKIKTDLNSNTGKTVASHQIRNILSHFLPKKMAFSLFLRMGTKEGYQKLTKADIADLMPLYKSDILKTASLTGLDVTDWLNTDE